MQLQRYSEYIERKERKRMTNLTANAQSALEAPSNFERARYALLRAIQHVAKTKGCSVVSSVEYDDCGFVTFLLEGVSVTRLQTFVKVAAALVNNNDRLCERTQSTSFGIESVDSEARTVKVWVQP